MAAAHASRGTKDSTQQTKGPGLAQKHTKSPTKSRQTRGTQVSLDPVKDTHEKWRQKTFGSDDHHCSLQPPFPPGRPASASASGEPILPDLRGYRLTLRTLACLLPYLVTLTSNRPKPMWGDPKLKPVWWPKVTPFRNPAAGGWEKGPVLRNRSGQNEGLMEMLEACYTYYHQEERFVMESVNQDSWNLMGAGDEV